MYSDGRKLTQVLAASFIAGHQQERLIDQAPGRDGQEQAIAIYERGLAGARAQMEGAITDALLPR
jgi:hypothetical protein